MSAAFGRDALLDAFDRIGRAAVLAGTKLQIAVYGGSALMLADGSPPGLAVSIPSADYLLALKLKAARIVDPLLGETERLDILNLMRVVGISTVEEAIALLGRYFPVSAASSEKQRFLLKNINREGGIDAPRYPR
jgi:hypothetical protein